jgi:hypothetical protein
MAACPMCNEPVRIEAKVTITFHPGGRWSLETPFEFEPNDDAECTVCDWSGICEEVEGYQEGSRIWPVQR